MKSRAVKIIGLVLSSAIILGLWLFFAPTKLGGSTTYSITSGISMEPLLHKNALALIQSQSSYQVGDVVLYQSPVLHKPVLHRIILIQDEKYFFKGDNNNFVDPGYATKDQLTGKLWMHIPKVGSILGWVGVPLHAAFIAGGLVIAIALTGFTTSRRRRTKHSGASANRSMTNQVKAALESPASSASGQETKKSLSYLEGPTSSLLALGVLTLLAVLCLVIGFSRPSNKLAPLKDAYQHTGQFSYSAKSKIPTPIYPIGAVQPGQPLYRNLIDTVTLDFLYEFDTSLPHDVKGTIELKALLLAQADKWQELASLQPPQEFTGDKITISHNQSLGELYGLIDSLTAQSGVPGATYTANIQPVIQISGTVGGQPIKDTFSPVIPVTIGPTSITLAAAAPAPSGATYAPSSADTGTSSTLHPVQSGSVPQTVSNKVSIAKYAISVPVLRVLSFIFGGLAITTALTHNFLRRKQTQKSEEELIADHFGLLMMPVTSLGIPEGAAQIEVPKFAQLAGLAQYLERPILYKDAHETRERVYAVDDDVHHYVTRVILPPHTTTALQAVTQTEPAFIKRVPLATIKQKVWNSLPLRIIAVIILFIFALTLVVSFTASNTVPVSYAGRSTQAKQIIHLKPIECSALALTSIVYKSGTTSNSVSNALIIGSPGIDTLTDTGNNNCIIGGAGKDKITARATSTCIIGPTTGATYTTCIKK